MTFWPDQFLEEKGRKRVSSRESVPKHLPASGGHRKSNPNVIRHGIFPLALSAVLSAGGCSNSRSIILSAKTARPHPRRSFDRQR